MAMRTLGLVVAIALGACCPAVGLPPEPAIAPTGCDVPGRGFVPLGGFVYYHGAGECYCRRSRYSTSGVRVVCWD
jgi:hypothetical protein